MTRVLDHGFVELIDTMGNDAAIVQAARVSYQNGTKTPSEDRALIRYLMRHDHTSPFEMCEIKLHVKCPIFVARQWVRHRTANLNEISGRYSILNDEFYIPNIDNVKAQSKTNRQGSENGLNDSTKEVVKLGIETNSIRCFRAYNDFIDNNVSREIARIALPLNTYTEFFWKIDLHNLFHFLKKRLENDAQWEIRQYARGIADMVKEWCPLAWEAFDEYKLNSFTMSKTMMEIIRNNWIFDVDEMVEDQENYNILSKREWDEFKSAVGIKCDEA